MLVILGKILVFLGAFFDGLYLSILFHELGHGIAAVLVTRQKVVSKVGTSKDSPGFSLGRLRIELGLKGFQYGFTYYERDRESRFRQILVALGGPLASIIIALLCAWWVLDTTLGGWLWVIGFACFVANIRILLVSLWPIKYRPFPDKDEVWLSDTLDIWRMLIGRNPEPEDRT